MLFWFKIWFYSVIFWKKCHFPSKIYISGGINFLEKSSNFLRKGVNLAVISGKMTIGIRSNLVVSLKKKWQFILFQFFRYLCFTGISGNLAETPILKDIFIFLANGHSFQKCSFLVEILSFLKEVFSVFEKCQILMALFLFGKKYHFMQKVLVFGQRSEFLSTVIKSSRAKLWGKVTSVFLNINFCAKLSIFWEKNWNFVRNFDFFKQLCSTSECEYLIGKHAYFQKILTFCVNVYIH